MPIYDFVCSMCKIPEKDYYVVQPTLKHYPICKNCGIYMNKLFPARVSILFGSSDLPHSGWDTFHPAFNRHFDSKRKIKEHLAELNSRRKDEAVDQGIPYRPIEWLGKGNDEMKEWDERRKAGEADIIYNSKVEEAQQKKLESELTPLLQEAVGDLPI